MCYSRKTIGRIIASILILCAVLYISSKNQNRADANTYFLPVNFIADKSNDNEALSVISANMVKENVNEEPFYSTNCKILLYHSHTNEAYLKNADNRYEHLASRSDDSSLTVCKAGEAMCEAFAKLGYDSDHDKSNNEAKGYNNAYTLSNELINKNIEANGQYLVHIDLHRDAYSKNTVPTVEINGKSVAKVMFVVGGKCENADENYNFACLIANELDKTYPGLCEKVLYVKASRYNQQYSNRSLLIEIGDNAVTVDEACNAAELVAEAIGKVLSMQNAVSEK